MQQILIHIIPIYFAAYAFISTFYPLRWHWSLKLVVGFALLLASQYAALSRAFYYGYDGLIPHAVLVVFAWLFTVELFLIGFCLIKDLFRAVRFWLNKSSPNRIRSSVITLFMAFVVGSLANYSALKVPVIKELTVEIDKLPDAFDGYRIAQLSDIHTSALLGQRRNEAIVRLTNDLHPNIIVITGDLVDGTVSTRRNDLLPLKHLQAPDGVIAIEGNHEHYVAHEDWRTFFPTIGIRWLENEHLLISKGKQKIAVAGITDPMAKRYARTEPSLDQALKGVPIGTTTILLAHQVKNSRLYAQHPIDLQLSGHTHGGQILGLHWLAQSLNNGFVKGLYRIDNMQLYINRGSGLWFGFPIRLGIESEITLITLKQAPK